jgi:Rad3-related DNA helicase
MIDYKNDPRWVIQRQVINEISEYFKHDGKYVIVRGPTGFGKSLTALVLAKEIGPTYITSTQVVLVDQYQDMLSNGFIGLGTAIKGLSNYRCKKEAPNAAEGPCHLPGYNCDLREKCDYYIARDKSINSNTAVMTFHYFMYPVRSALLEDKNIEFNSKNDKYFTWQKRKILVIDEAHDLPEVLRDFFSITVKERTFGVDLFNDLKSASYELADEELIEFLKQKLIILQPKVERVVKDLSKIAEKITEDTMSLEYGGKTYTRKDFLIYVAQQNSLLRKIIHFIDTINRNNDWVFTREFDAFVWKPFEAGVYMKSLFDKFDYVVFMSATFVDHKLYASRFGISEYKFIDIPSRFDPNKGKIYLYYDNWLNKKSPDSVKGRVMARIESIAKNYSIYKGIIHCHTYEWQKYIYESASFGLKRRLLIHDPTNRSAVLKEFYLENTPKILLSVNMDKGLDLKDDLARWQILVKCPYPYLGDRWVDEHRKRMPEWYTENTLMTIIQACGRIVRNDKDWGHTYILDGNASNLIEKNADKLPEWFTHRIQHLH